MPICPGGTMASDDGEDIHALLVATGAGSRKPWAAPRVILGHIARDAAGGTTTGFSTDVKLTATTVVAS